MKTLIIFIFLSFITSSSFSQYNYQILTEYVNTFQTVKIESQKAVSEILKDHNYVIEKLSPLDIKILALEKYINSLPQRDFLNIIEKRIKTYEQNLYALQEFQIRHDEEIDNKFLKDSVRFAIYDGILNRRLEKIYGEAFAQLIISPILIRAKIKNQESKPYTVKNDFHIELKIIIVEIQDIIKGKSQLHKGTSVRFYYLPFWTHLDKKFTNNESYFISLLPVIDNVSGERRLALNVNNVNGGIIKITDNIVMDYENYFELGNLSWQEFKNKVNTIISINKFKEE